MAFYTSSPKLLGFFPRLLLLSLLWSCLCLHPYSTKGLQAPLGGRDGALVVGCVFLLGYLLSLLPGRLTLQMSACKGPQGVPVTSFLCWCCMNLNMYSERAPETESRKKKKVGFFLRGKHKGELQGKHAVESLLVISSPRDPRTICYHMDRAPCFLSKKQAGVFRRLH